MQGTQSGGSAELLSMWPRSGTKTASFPGSLVFPRSSLVPGGGKIRDPGNEVGTKNKLSFNLLILILAWFFSGFSSSPPSTKTFSKFQCDLLAVDELEVTRGVLTDNFHSHVYIRELVGALRKSKTMHVGADTRGEQ